jgi:UDP-GlcNAc:undecaprenyl-phosphate GlcNAc-1-phosphate transferase
MVGERDEHIHYRLLRLGHSHRRAVLLMYGWAVLLAAGLVIAGTISWGRFVLAITAAAGTVLILTLSPRLRRPPASNEEDPLDDAEEDPDDAAREPNEDGETL